MHFLDDKEKAEFEANVAAMKPLVKDPHAAVQYLTESQSETYRAVGEIRRMIDEFDGDDPFPLLAKIQEELRNLAAHLDGTDIGFVNDFGAWFTKEGWKPGAECPMHDSHIG